MFSFGKLKLYISIIAVVASIISWKFYDFISVINKQNAEIDKLRKQYVVAQVDLKTERENVKLITKVVEDQHKTIDTLKARNQDIVTKFNNFKIQADKDKYKSAQALKLMQSELFKSNSCEAGIELNKEISKLKYKDL